jgi:hypothetical protein
MLAAEDDVFLAGAYRLLLEREADGDGADFYGRRLAMGSPRLEVLAELARSDEAARVLARDRILRTALEQALGAAAPRSPTLAELLALGDVDFIDAALRHLQPQAATLPQRRQWLARLHGSGSREGVLRALVDAADPGAQTQIAGLDEWLKLQPDGLAAVATSPAQLLARVDEDFVDAAYHAVLGRSPDFHGWAHCMGRLAAGCSRSAVLYEMAVSTEARQRPTVWPELESWVRRQRRWRMPLLRVLAGWMGWLESESSRARALRQFAHTQRRVQRLESGWAPMTVGSRAPDGTDCRDGAASLEALLQRHETLLDLQRDRFERQLRALKQRLDTLVPPRIDGPRRRNRRGRPRR